MGEDHTPAEVHEPVIRTSRDAANALAQRFFDNANTGADASNDDLVEQLGAWQRTRRFR